MKGVRGVQGEGVREHPPRPPPAAAWGARSPRAVGGSRARGARLGARLGGWAGSPDAVAVTCLAAGGRDEAPWAA